MKISISFILYIFLISFRCFCQDIPISHGKIFSGEKFTICKGDSLILTITKYYHCCGNSNASVICDCYPLYPDDINLTDQYRIWLGTSCDSIVQGNHCLPQLEGPNSAITEITYDVEGNACTKKVFGKIVCRFKPEKTSRYKISWQTNVRYNTGSTYINSVLDSFDIIVNDPLPPTILPKDTTVGINSSFLFRVNADFRTYEQKVVASTSANTVIKNDTFGLNFSNLHYRLEPLIYFQADSPGLFSVKAKIIDSGCPTDFSYPASVKVECAHPPELFPKDTTVKLNSNFSFKVNADFSTYDQKIVLYKNSSNKGDTTTLGGGVLHYKLKPLANFYADKTGEFTVKAKILDGGCSSGFSGPVKVKVEVPLGNIYLVDPVKVGKVNADGSIKTDLSSYSLSTNILGTVTDGLSKILLIAKASEPITFSLNYAKDGKLSSLNEPFNFSNQIVIKPVNGRIAVIYTPPDGYGNTNPAIGKTIYVNVKDQVFKINKKVGIKLQTPSVVLIHGMWSDPDVWIKGGFYKSLAAAGFPFVYLADYHERSAETFNPVGAQVALKLVKKTIDLTLSHYKTQWIAGAQVDVVGHSLGGLMARSISTMGDFKSAQNYNKGLSTN